MDEIIKELEKLKLGFQDEYHKLMDSGKQYDCVHDITDIADTKVETMNTAIELVKIYANDGWHVVAYGDLPEESGTYIVTQAMHSLKEHNKILRTDTECVDFSNGMWKRAKHLEVIAWRELPPKYIPK